MKVRTNTNYIVSFDSEDKKEFGFIKVSAETEELAKQYVETLKPGTSITDITEEGKSTFVQEIKPLTLLANEPWTVIGSTDHLDELKVGVMEVCNQIAGSIAIDEICVLNLLSKLRQLGYEVVSGKQLKELQ